MPKLLYISKNTGSPTFIQMVYHIVFFIIVAIVFCGKSPKIGQTDYIPVCLQPTGLMAVAGYRSYEGCWTAFGAVGWQPIGLMGVAGLWRCRLATYSSWGPLGLQVGDLHVLGRPLRQPTALMGVAGRPLGLQVGNLQLSWGLLDGLCGCRLATYSSYGSCWTAFGAVGWQPTTLMGVAGWPLWL